MTAPCKDCPDRAQGCHGRCEKYAAFLKAHNQALENKNRYLDAESATVLGVYRMNNRNPIKQAEYNRKHKK